MSQFEYQLQELESLVDQLLDVAKEIEETSRLDPKEDRLIPLQEKQEELIHQIQKKDQQLSSPKEQSEKGALIEARILAKLQEFEQSNQHAVQNLRTRGGLLYFDRYKG